MQQAAPWSRDHRCHSSGPHKAVTGKCSSRAMLAGHARCASAPWHDRSLCPPVGPTRTRMQTSPGVSYCTAQRRQGCPVTRGQAGPNLDTSCAQQGHARCTSAAGAAEIGGALAAAPPAAHAASPGTRTQYSGRRSHRYGCAPAAGGAARQSRNLVVATPPPAHSYAPAYTSVSSVSCTCAAQAPRVAPAACLFTTVACVLRPWLHQRPQSAGASAARGSGGCSAHHATEAAEAVGGDQVDVAAVEAGHLAGPAASSSEHKRRRPGRSRRQAAACIQCIQQVILPSPARTPELVPPDRTAALQSAPAHPSRCLRTTPGSRHAQRACARP